MMWALVFVLLNGNQAKAEVEGRYKSLTECFEAREHLAVVKGGGAPGYYPNGSQGICIYGD